MLAWFVGRFHVATPDAAIRDAVRARIPATATPAERKATLARAVRIHRANRRLYARVMGGGQ